MARDGNRLALDNFSVEAKIAGEFRGRDFAHDCSNQFLPITLFTSFTLFMLFDQAPEF